MRDKCLKPALVLLAALGTLAACARGGPELRGWHASQAGMELSWEEGAGPQGEGVFALLYTVATGQDYAIERHTPIRGLQGQPRFCLLARATRVLYLTLVLVDHDGRQHECSRALLPGEWRKLCFHDFESPIDDWEHVAALRLVERIGSLGGQGPVSLKLVGLPMESQ